MPHWTGRLIIWYARGMRSNFADNRTGLHSGGELLVGAPAIASFLGVHTRLVGTLGRERGLPVRRLGNSLVATRRQVLEWIESLPVVGASDAGA